MSMMIRIKTLYRFMFRFIRRGLWQPTTGRVRSVLVGMTQRLVVTTRLFVREDLYYRASALTYSSMFAVVPILAIVFAIAQGFGLGEYIESSIRDSIAAKPEIADVVVGFVKSYLTHTHSGIFLGFGLLVLLWSLLSLTGSIESVFNDIWQVKRKRPALRMITDYTAVFFLLPVFIIVSSGLSILAYTVADKIIPNVMILRPMAVEMVQMLPYVFVCGFFTALFAFMPNTKVSFRSAIMAGVPTGIAFQIVQTLYVHSQVWLTSYNTIYGSFAALPLFMLMCQISWTVCLYGATLSYVDQNIGNFYYGNDVINICRLDHDCICLQLTAAVCRRFAKSQTPFTAETLARDQKVHLRIVTEITDELAEAGVLMKVYMDEGEQSFVPSCDINLITPAYVLTALDSNGDRVEPFHDGRGWTEYRRLRTGMYEKVFSAIPLYRVEDDKTHVGG